jgi:N-acyl-D-aspartate/D-glutamate deacylase
MLLADNNSGLLYVEGQTVGQIAQMQCEGIVDAFLDLVVDQNLDAWFLQGEINVDEAAMAQILTYSNAIIGLSDGVAHVLSQSGCLAKRN